MIQPKDLGIGSLFWAIREAVVVADATTNQIVLWNPAAEEIFGYSAAEAIGRSTDLLIPPHYHARHQAGLHRYYETGHGRIIDARAALELPALHKTGRTLAVELTLCRLAQ